MRSIAPGGDDGRGAVRLVAPDHHQRHAQDLSHLPCDGGEHLRRRRPAGHERRDPPQRRPLLREDGIVLAQHALGAQAVLDVGEGHDRAAALPHLDRHRDVGDGEERSVAPDEPVQIARDRLAGGPREQHRAVRGGIGRPVRVLVVDRLVAVAPEQLVRAVVAERVDRGGVGEPDQAVGIDDPDRLRSRLQHGAEEILRADAQAGQIGQGIRHAELRCAIESTPGGVVEKVGSSDAHETSVQELRRPLGHAIESDPPPGEQCRESDWQHRRRPDHDTEPPGSASSRSTTAPDRCGD